MQVFLLILFGFFAGVVGGMGMGGGTILVPLLSFVKMEQQTMQAINLISFIPMSTVALIIHSKNKLIVKSKILWIIVPACLSAIGGSILSTAIDSAILRKIFGIFLIALGIWQVVVACRKFKTKAKAELMLYTSKSLSVIAPVDNEQNIIEKIDKKN
ncbi:MAG: sulfite exporter TauE/SafE family protein [Clostridia bacterium]